MAYLISSSCTLFPAMLFVDAVPWGANGMFFFRPWSSLSPKMGIMGRTVGFICCLVAVGRQSGYKRRLSTGMDTAPARWFGTKILQNRKSQHLGFSPNQSFTVCTIFVYFFLSAPTNVIVQNSSAGLYCEALGLMLLSFSLQGVPGPNA